MNIKEEREKHIISQADLANMLGCTQDLVSKWETGKHRPSNKYLRKMVDVFARLESVHKVNRKVAFIYPQFSKSYPHARKRKRAGG